MNKIIKSIIILLFLMPVDLLYAQGVIVVERAKKICQLTGEYDRQKKEPTPNRTQSRYKLKGTDLGVPFRHKDRIYLLFGDTWGPPGGDAIAWTVDTSPEDGLELEFIHDQTGTYRPVRIPCISQGDFEVPMEGISIHGRMYIYHTTDHSLLKTMGRSVVAVSDDDGRTFTYLYDLSTEHFINVSVVHVDTADWKGLPQGKGMGMVMFGSGSYRKSSVRLGFQAFEHIGLRTGIRYFKGIDASGKPIWSSREQDAAELFGQYCVGELSVSYNRFIRKWIMLYNGNGKLRGINMRTSDTPWGKWSEPKVIFNPWQDNGYCYFMHIKWSHKKCDSVHEPGWEDVWGGEYGPYQFEDLAVGDSSSTTIYFTMSTCNPYTVVLMKVRLKIK